MRRVAIAACILAAVAIAIARSNVPELALEAIAGVQQLFSHRVDPDLQARHDSAIARAVAERDSTRVIADSLEHQVVPPALERDSAARHELRRVLAVDTTVPIDVDSLKGALEVTAAAAAQLDTSSTRAIGSLLALVAAKTAEASASDTVASRAQVALDDERRDRARERWIYRAKIAAALLGGAVIGAIAHAL